MTDTELYEALSFETEDLSDPTSIKHAQTTASWLTGCNTVNSKAACLCCHVMTGQWDFTKVLNTLWEVECSMRCSVFQRLKAETWLQTCENAPPVNSTCDPSKMGGLCWPLTCSPPPPPGLHYTLQSSWSHFHSIKPNNCVVTSQGQRSV